MSQDVAVPLDINSDAGDPGPNPLAGRLLGINLPTTPGIPPVNLPVPGFPTGGGSTPGSGTYTSNTNVSSNQPLNLYVDTVTNIANNGVDDLAAAIQSSIAAAATGAGTIAEQTGQSIIDSIGALSGAILDSTNAGLKNIGDQVGAIANAVELQSNGLVAGLVGGLESIVSAIGGALGQIFSPVVGAIEDVAHNIGNINLNNIGTVIAGITQVITTVHGTIQAIERDLKGGLGGIAQAATDISNAVGAIDQDLTRVGTQLGTDIKGTAQVTIGGSADDTLWTRLKDLSGTLGPNGTVSQLSAVFADKVNLADPNMQQIIQLLIRAIDKDAKGVLGAVSGSLDNLWNELNSTWQDGSGFAGAIAGGIFWVIGAASLVVTQLEPALFALIDQANSNLPLKKLPPAQVIQAFKRQFISDEKATQELSYAGLDATRAQLLKDLAAYLPGVSESIDWYYRGLIDEQALNEALSENGLDSEQMVAAVSAAEKLVDVNLAIKAWRRKEIDWSVVEGIMATDRYTKAEQDLVTLTRLEREKPEGFINTQRFNDVARHAAVTDPRVQNIPQTFLDLCQAVGMDGAATTDLWISQFQVPEISQWMTLFYRGLRSKDELYGALDYYRVPEDWKGDYVEASRPIIPFRTIPSMLSNGIISEVRAAQLLAKHGYDVESVNELIAYSKVNRKAAAAKTANDLKSISIQSAKTAWNDGALTETQYHDVLIAHGFDEATAALTVKVETMERGVKERQVSAQDIVNEALAGFITQDDAARQLAQQNYTVAEQAKYLKQLRKQSVVSAKVPPIADLKKFWAAGLITDKDYQNALATHGFADKWVQAYRQIDNPGPPFGFAVPIITVNT